MHTTTPVFLCKNWKSNSGPHVCTVNTLPTELSPSSQVWKISLKICTSPRREQRLSLATSKQWSWWGSQALLKLRASSAVYFNVFLSSAVCLTDPFVLIYVWWLHFRAVHESSLLRNDFSSHLSSHLSCDMTSSPPLLKEMPTARNFHRHLSFYICLFHLQKKVEIYKKRNTSHQWGHFPLDKTLFFYKIYTQYWIPLQTQET